MAPAEIRFRVMASDAHVIVVDGPPQALAMAKRILERLEAIWSRFVSGSDIDRLNQHAGRPTRVSRPTLTLIDKMLEGWRTSAGSFDPTILPALADLGYRASIDNPALTTTLPPAAVHPAAGGKSPELVVVDHEAGTITIPFGMALDPGGIGKGLAADLVVAELLSRGAAGALVSIGGDIAAAGTAVHPLGWMVEIEDPFERDTVLSTVAISGGGVATSSTISRRWESDGAVRHHVVDPGTRLPSATDLAAVTVIAPCGWQAEIAATALLAGGASQLAANAVELGVDAMAVTVGGAVKVAGQFADLELDKAVA